jgi:hypothetical protein
MNDVFPSSENLHEESFFQASNSFDFESTCRATSAFNKISVLGCNLLREHTFIDNDASINKTKQEEMLVR